MGPLRCRSRNAASESFYFPEWNSVTLTCRNLLFHLRKYEPEKTWIKSQYSSLHNCYINVLLASWTFRSSTTLQLFASMFGETALATRYYPDSEGIIDFENRQGGILYRNIGGSARTDFI